MTVARVEYRQRRNISACLIRNPLQPGSLVDIPGSHLGGFHDCAKRVLRVKNRTHTERMKFVRRICIARYGVVGEYILGGARVVIKFSRVADTVMAHEFYVGCVLRDSLSRSSINFVKPILFRAGALLDRPLHRSDPLRRRCLQRSHRPPQASPMMVMEHVRNIGTLRDVLTTGPKATICASLLLQTACALSMAHEEVGFVHNDLHLDNILVSSINDDIAFAFCLIGVGIVLLPSCGVFPTIIDYGFSSVNHLSAVSSKPPFANWSAAFSNLGIYPGHRDGHHRDLGHLIGGILQTIGSGDDDMVRVLHSTILSNDLLSTPDSGDRSVLKIVGERVCKVLDRKQYRYGGNPEHTTVPLPHQSLLFEPESLHETLDLIKSLQRFPDDGGDRQPRHGVCDSCIYRLVRTWATIEKTLGGSSRAVARSLLYYVVTMLKTEGNAKVNNDAWHSGIVNQVRAEHRRLRCSKKGAEISK